jgi:hypothetical protein
MAANEGLGERNRRERHTAAIQFYCGLDGPPQGFRVNLIPSLHTMSMSIGAHESDGEFVEWSAEFECL